MKPYGIWGASAVLVVAVCATTGCATKKYVRQQTGIVSAKVDEVEKKQQQALAELDQKMQRDVSRAEERALTADSKANEAVQAAGVADTKANEAMQAAKTAGDGVQRVQSEAGELGDAVANVDRFAAVFSTDVLFGFNRRTLTEEGREKLDDLAQKATAQRRFVIEVAGYTDPSGSPDYNLALSRVRADVVVRYLVENGVPLRHIRMIGLGEFQNTSFAASDGAPLKHRDMRRVVVTLYAPTGKLWASNVR